MLRATFISSLKLLSSFPQHDSAGGWGLAQCYRFLGGRCLELRGHLPAPGAVLHVEPQEVIEHGLPERQPGTGGVGPGPIGHCSPGVGTVVGTWPGPGSQLMPKGPEREVTTEETPQLVLVPGLQGTWDWPACSRVQSMTLANQEVALRTHTKAGSRTPTPTLTPISQSLLS